MGAGYWFPYHPALANEGWAQAVRERGKEERLRALEQWRPNLEVPLSIYIQFLEAEPGARKLKIRFLGFDPKDREAGWRGDLVVTEAGE